jgi:lipid II isoglutaminyl synthase (glutamine-hydrolysing)
VLVLLIKNPAGANEAVRTLVSGGAPRVAVVALNDAIADGQDVSWIWDVDFEPLFEAAGRIVVTGERAAELALRCVYGGLPPERLELAPELADGLDRGLELTPSGASLVVLPTYTAMLRLRAIAAERGLVRPYWEADGSRA